MSLWKGDLGNGEYANPILYGDYSDPDLIRVGKDFYMISSSFTYVPGVPVLHSRDLVNWELINYCVRKLPFPRYNQPAHGCGTWAPSLRYHNGMFYAFIPLPDEGIFVTAAEDPRGEWSPLRCIRQAKGWIDPCPLWDEDGRAYMAFAYARSRCGIKHRLNICEIDGKTLEVLTDPVEVYDGTLQNPTIEGPKLYRRNGYYYIFAPAGGVPTGWQTVLRSRNIYGPYEARIVMHQGGTPVNGPHQGGYVETEDGSCFFAHFQDVGSMGRIIHLQPMCWKEDWPFIGVEQNGDGIGEPVQKWSMPIADAGEASAYEIAVDDNFDSADLGLQWQWQANPNPGWYDLKARPGYLRLFVQSNPERESNLLWYAPNVMTQIPQAPGFDVVLALELHGSQEGDCAGMGMLGHEYSYLAIAWARGSYTLRLVRGHVKDPGAPGEAAEDLSQETAISAPRLWLKAMVREGCRVSYAWSEDGERFQAFGVTFPVREGTWTGAKLAVFALNSSNRASAGYADLESIHFRKAD